MITIPLVFALLAAPAHASFETLGAFSDGGWVEADFERGVRLLFKSPEGRLIRGAALPGQWQTHTRDGRFLALNFRSGGGPRLALFSSNGRMLLDEAVAEGANFAIESDDRRVRLMRDNETIAADLSGKIICHAKADPSAACGKD